MPVKVEIPEVKIEYVALCDGQKFNSEKDAIAWENNYEAQTFQVDEKKLTKWNPKNWKHFKYYFIRNFAVLYTPKGKKSEPVSCDYYLSIDTAKKFKKFVEDAMYPKKRDKFGNYIGHVEVIFYTNNLWGYYIYLKDKNFYFDKLKYTIYENPFLISGHFFPSNKNLFDFYKFAFLSRMINVKKHYNYLLNNAFLYGDKDVLDVCLNHYKDNEDIFKIILTSPWRGFGDEIKKYIYDYLEFKNASYIDDLIFETLDRLGEKDFLFKYIKERKIKDSCFFRQNYDTIYKLYKAWSYIGFHPQKSYYYKELKNVSTKVIKKFLSKRVYYKNLDGVLKALEEYTKISKKDRIKFIEMHMGWDSSYGLKDNKYDLYKDFYIKWSDYIPESRIKKILKDNPEIIIKETHLMPNPRKYKVVKVNNPQYSELGPLSPSVKIPKYFEKHINNENK